jgi:hypothetical protein
MIRALILLLALLPFVVFAALDLVVHFTSRKPPLLEDLVHLGLGAGQVTLAMAAFRGDLARMAVGGLVVVLLGGVDEFVFHRALPPRESDLHAKGHFALFAFLVVALAVRAFPDAQSFTRLLGTPS